MLSWPRWSPRARLFSLKSTFQNEVPRPLGMALVEPSQEGGARAALLLEGRSNHRVSTGLNTAELSGRRRGVVVHEAVLVLPNPGHAGVVALRGGLDEEHTVAVLIRALRRG